ncbi:MAG: PucR family transcriptional regulator, partial [Acidimicrobiales bacterium]
ALEQARSAIRIALPGAVGTTRGGSTLLLVPVVGASVEEVQQRISAALGPLLVVAGVGHQQAPAGVREASTLASDLAGLALRAGRPPGVYGLGSLLVDYMLDRLPELGTHLDGLVADLSPELRVTLERWLATRDRRAVADELHVHPNTVGHRLRRAAELTGVDPTSAEGAMTLYAALAARKH